MKIKSQKDLWSGVMFLAIGVGFAWGATEYSFGTSARPGPAYFPFGLGIILALLGVATILESLASKAQDGDLIGHIAWRPLLIILGAVVGFGFLLPRAGLVITLPFLIVLSSWASDEFRLTTALISSVVLTVASWLIFVKGLGLTIPMWPALAFFA
jgi:hypothetical protein